MSEQEMSPEQRKFEEAIIDMAIKEHHKYCMVYKRAKSEAEAKMFYTAMKIGVTQGINYATKQFMDYNKNLEEKTNETKHKD